MERVPVEKKVLSENDRIAAELRQRFAAFQHPVPAGVRNQHREDDGADALGDDMAEQQTQCRHQDQQYRQLADLDAEIETQ